MEYSYRIKTRNSLNELRQIATTQPKSLSTLQTTTAFRNLQEQSRAAKETASEIRFQGKNRQRGAPIAMEGSLTCGFPINAGQDY
jgi:hypothetical protein